MSSRFIVKAVYGMDGIGKDSGDAYDMKRCVTLSDFEAFRKVDKVTGQVITNRQGAGFSDCEVVVSDSFYPRLLAFFNNEFNLKRAPILMDLETSVRSRGRNTETIIVDFAESFKAKHPALKDTVAA